MGRVVIMHKLEWIFQMTKLIKRTKLEIKVREGGKQSCGQLLAR